MLRDYNAWMLYRFGQFEFDSQTRLLFRAQKRLPLTPKAADLLFVLLEHEGRLLGKDELLRLVWPDSFVEEGSLSKHIFSLRKTLEDQGESAQFIETIPKRGYRFIGSLERTAEEERASAVVVEEMTREHLVIETQDLTSTWYRRPWPVLALVCGLILIIGAVAWSVRSRGRVARPLRSLLVLPFANMGPSENEYFSDGLTEELIAAFSGVQGLRVIPRTTAFQFKGKSGDLRAIGRQLETDAVLDGGVQREGDRLRIRLSLTRVSDGQTIWSRSYDRGIQDVFVTQEEVARGVIHAVFPGEGHSIDVPPPSGTKNLEAQTLYLKGMFMKQKFDTDAALPLLEQATALDPAYAQAWAGQAACRALLGYGYRKYPKDAYPDALKTVQHALALNPRLALPHATLGWINRDYLWDWKTARRELETAIELDPNDGESHHVLSHHWVSLGQFSQALQESHRALECDPLNLSFGSHQVWAEMENANFPRAIEAAKETLRLDPRHIPTSAYLIRAYEESGQIRQAIEVRQRMDWGDPIAEMYAALNTEGPAGYWRSLARHHLETRAKVPFRPVEIAVAYTHAGDHPKALAWLEQAAEERDPFVIYMKVDPAFASLRSDPRFQKIARTIGIP
jgi:TolB-like protein/DNA-binding winged helix-turn-helix (wHTH) protein/tetratricopeptide (TPR) repeat protein